MSRRSLPERTVDAWVSATISERFPNADIWAPTERENDPNWDYGVSLGDGKVFILEDKATQPTKRLKKPPLDTHMIRIDLDQLDWYCDDVEPETGVPVFYVLPKPPWIGEPLPVVVPAEAVTRVASPSGPFSDWAYVIRCHDLRAVTPSPPQQSSQIDTHDLPLPHSESLKEFLDSVAECRSDPVMRRVGPGDESRALASDGVLPQTRSVRTASAESGHRLTQALAVFVPAEDLDVWAGPEEEGAS